MAILINDNYSLQAVKPFDARYMNISTPWASCVAAIAGIPTYRYQGLTININGEEWWWKDGIGDGDLIQKSLGGTGNVSGATNGISLVCGGTYVALGGTLTGNTTFDGTASKYTLQYGADYSSTFVPRTLVDQGYVTGLTSQAILTASNGLCKNSSTNVCLGGTLSSDVTITTGTNEFKLCKDALNYFCFDGGITNPSIGSLISNGGSCCVSFAMSTFNTQAHLRVIGDAGICVSCLVVKPDSFLTASFNTNMLMNLSGITVTDGNCSRGFVYGSNYCAAGKTNPRWIPDNAYVTGLTSGLATASNGLTAVGQDVRLGGTLSQNTDICLGGSWDLCIRNSGATNCTVGEFTPTAINLCGANPQSPFEIGRITASYLDTELCNGFTNCSSCMNMSNSAINFLICGGVTDAYMKVTDNTTNQRGVEYAADYSSTYIARSLVDAEYVTGRTSQAILTANNGLTKVGTNAVLGGDLTGTTAIILTGNALRIQSDATSCGLAIFDLNTTYANSKFGICSMGATGAQWGFSGNSTSINAQHCSNASNGSSIGITDTCLTLTNKNSSVSKTVNLNPNALVYGDCYHSCYVDRTLIDKEYLDIQLSGTSNVIEVCIIGTSYITKRYDDLIGVSGISTNQICLYPTPVLGQRLTVVDICGNALADPITIDGNGILINNGVCSTINTDYGSVTYVYNGIFWSAVAFVN